MDYTTINNCIKILNKKPTWFFQKENIAEKLQCLDTLKEIGKPNTISSLVVFLNNDDLLIRKKAAETILHLFSKLKSVNEYSNSLKYLSIKSDDLYLYRAHFEEKIYSRLLGMASLNSYGYVREKAVKEIARLRAKEELKFILLRLGDWVHPVKIAATEAIDLFLNALCIDELLKELPTIEGLLHVKRADLGPIHNRIIQFILSQGLSEDFFSKLNALSDTARFCYYKNLFTQPGKYEAAINKIARDRNFLVRLEVVKHLSAFDVLQQKRLLTDFLLDHSARVKITALQAAKVYIDEFSPTIHRLLSDESASVRTLCRHLLKNEDIDFAGIYRERIKKGQHVPGSLAGLSEVGNIEDLVLFEQHIHSDQGKIIVACLVGITKFDQDKAVIYATKLLPHPAQKIRNKAAEILIRNSNNETLEKIRAIYTSGNPAIKKTILTLFYKIGGWRIMGDLLLSLTDEDIDIQNSAWLFLQKWNDKSVRLFTTPSKQDMERANHFLKELDKYKSKMKDSRISLLQDLQFYIRQ